MFRYHVEARETGDYTEGPGEWRTVYMGSASGEALTKAHALVATGMQVRIMVDRDEFVAKGGEWMVPVAALLTINDKISALTKRIEALEKTLGQEVARLKLYAPIESREDFLAALKEGADAANGITSGPGPATSEAKPCEDCGNPGWHQCPGKSTPSGAATDGEACSDCNNGTYRKPLAHGIKVSARCPACSGTGKKPAAKSEHVHEWAPVGTCFHCGVRRPAQESKPYVFSKVDGAIARAQNSKSGDEEAATVLQGSVAAPSSPSSSGEKCKHMGGEIRRCDGKYTSCRDCGARIEDDCAYAELAALREVAEAARLYVSTERNPLDAYAEHLKERLAKLDALRSGGKEGGK